MSERQRLPQDQVFDLLSNRRRRFVLTHLRRTDGPVTLKELATAVAAWENDVPPEDLTDQQRKRVYVSLYQTHVPKLEDAGVVDYDADSGMVSLAGRADEVGAYLSRGERRPWQWYYLALAAVGAAVYLAVAAGVPGFAALPASAVVAGIALAFAVLAIVHIVSTRNVGT